MLTFRELSLEVHRRDTGEGIVAIYSRGPLVGDPDAYSCEAGIRGLSFYCTEADFVALLTGKVDSLSDGYHGVRRFVESYTFFDMEFPRESRGVLPLPYVRLEIPNAVARVLVRAVRMTLRRCVPNGDRLRVEIPFETRERWVRQYGQGTGEVRFEIPEDQQARYRECAATGGPSFKNCIENLERIALNNTWRHTDVSTVYLSKDRNGWYFCIYSPKGARRMNGGVINHGSDGNQDWSTHT